MTQNQTSEELLKDVPKISSRNIEVVGIWVFTVIIILIFNTLIILLFDLQELWPLSSDISTHLTLATECGPNESTTEGNCDLLAGTDISQLSLEIEKER